jgi:pimeloyl-ACP methyl ester carboxylesterase
MIHARALLRPLAGLAALVWVLTAPAQARVIEDAGYPVEDPIVATVVGTPAEVAAELPALELDTNVLRDSVVLFPDRPIPSVFWYQQGGFEYAVVYQTGPAPLVVLIAGTGSDFNARSMQILSAALYKGGFHVLAIASPTVPNFMVTASEHGVPGRMSADTRDIARAVSAILDELRPSLQITGLHLAGYSLGAMHAAFLAKADAQHPTFGFEKTLLINPPVSLWTSARRLDALLDRNIRNDPRRVQAFLDTLLAAFAELYSAEGALDLTGDFLYRAYERLRPSGELLETLVGFSFRLASTNMTFASDVLTHIGYLVPPMRELTPTSSLTPYLVAGTYRSFEDYIEGMFLPFWQTVDPGLNIEEARAQASLESIESFLRESSHVGLFTTADDIILAPGQLDWLENVFGDRALIFPHGGHTGNYAEKRFVEELIRYFKNAGM